MRKMKTGPKRGERVAKNKSAKPAKKSPKKKKMVY